MLPWRNSRLQGNGAVPTAGASKTGSKQPAMARKRRPRNAKSRCFMAGSIAQYPSRFNLSQASRRCGILPRLDDCRLAQGPAPALVLFDFSLDMMLDRPPPPAPLAAILFQIIAQETE